MNWVRTSKDTWRRGDWVIHIDRDGPLDIYREGKHVREIKPGPSPDYDRLLADAQAYCDRQERPKVSLFSRFLRRA